MSGVLKLGSTTLGTENNGKIDLTNVGESEFSSTNHTWTVKAIDEAIVGATYSTKNDSDSGQLAIYNGATKLWGITEHGFTQNPNVPAFHAFYNNNTSKSNSALLGTPLIFNYTFLNNQNCYSTSTGYFTSPINGIYHFVFFGIKGSTTSDEGRVTYLINGSPNAGAGYVYPQARGEIDHSYTQMVAAMTVYLNAGDNVRLDSVEGGLYASGSEGNGNNPNWMGYLIG